jgi:hypothetical protein
MFRLLRGHLQLLQAVETPYPIEFNHLTRKKTYGALLQPTRCNNILQIKGLVLIPTTHDIQHPTQYTVNVKDTQSSGDEKHCCVFICFTSEYNAIYAERLQWTWLDIRKLSYMISVILPTYRLVLLIKTVLFVFIHNNSCEAAWDPIVCWHFVWFRFDRLVN